MNIQPIETVYQGYRFRSRLEARWAVFFDAAGIEWQYEPEGYVVNGQPYLPDFWLPQLKVFVETKPHLEAAKLATPTMALLVAETGHDGLVIAGAPNVIEQPVILRITGPDSIPPFVQPASWRQCAFCDFVGLYIEDHKCCAPSVVLRGSRFDTPRVDHAMGEAQRARFEHGENGRPQPYKPTASKSVAVYLAGAVLETKPEEIETEEIEAPDDEQPGPLPWRPELLPWRSEIFGVACEANALVVGHTTHGRFRYGGPSLLEDHGIVQESLARSCLDEVHRAHALFAWIDRTETVGTLVEIGAAYALRRPIFTAFANKELADNFYFARQVSNVAVISPDAITAWKLFTRWRGSL